MQNLPALAGMIGPVFYFVLLAILGLLWEGYDPVSTGMSEIGAVDAPFRDVMNYFGFSLLGLSIIAFSVGFHYCFPRDFQMSIAVLLLLAGGVVMFSIGFLPCDSLCVDVTRTGEMHTLASTFVAIVIPLSALVSANPISKKWGSKWGYASFGLGFASMLAGPVMFIDALSGASGLVQRAGIGLSLVWIVAVAANMFWRSR